MSAINLTLATLVALYLILTPRLGEYIFNQLNQGPKWVLDTDRGFIYVLLGIGTGILWLLMPSSKTMLPLALGVILFLYVGAARGIASGCASAATAYLVYSVGKDIPWQESMYAIALTAVLTMVLHRIGCSIRDGNFLGFWIGRR